MLITHSSKTHKTPTKLPATASLSMEQAPKKQGDSFLKTAGDKALHLIRRTARAAKPYAKSALVAAAPALATAVAASLGGIPAAALAVAGCGLVGAVAGGIAWGEDIGLIKGIGAGGLAGLSSAFLGGVGGAAGVVNMAAIGATREAILRHLADR